MEEVLSNHSKFELIVPVLKFLVIAAPNLNLDGLRLAHIYEQSQHPMVIVSCPL